MVSRDAVALNKSAKKLGYNAILFILILPLIYQEVLFKSISLLQERHGQNHNIVK